MEHMQCEKSVGSLSLSPIAFGASPITAKFICLRDKLRSMLPFEASSNVRCLFVHFQQQGGREERERARKVRSPEGGETHIEAAS